MDTILFLHGFFASGSCVPALTLQEALAGKVRVLTPDLPLHPEAALDYVRRLCGEERPRLLVGNSCGSFLAQMLAPQVGVPALLGNPHFEMARFLQTRLGERQYKSPRRDGKQAFVVDDALIAEFARLERHQFDGCTPYYIDKVWGLFGTQDTLARYEPLFTVHYSHAFHFPGAHTPTADEVRRWYVPLVERMLRAFPTPSHEESPITPA
ncbi:MAG: alpha/beta fold hydrolase [Prevotellaceae bacterium]|nr:alpha/beta fold hydrolase [Prevotellaceae bacterium]